MKPTESAAESSSDQEREKGRGVALVIRLLLPVILLVGGGIGYTMLSREKPEQAPDRPQPKPLEVRVQPLQRQSYQIQVRSQGEIRAHNQVGITAQVSGRIQFIHPVFEEGAFFREGDVLLELDPVDFQDAIVAAEAQLAQAKLALAQEKIRAEQARLDWEDLGYDTEPSEFVLRIPQVKLAEKQVELAEAAKVTAERNLARAQVRAPFDGRVLSRAVGLGQTIGASTPLGEVFATDYSEVRLPLSTRFLKDVTLPEDLSDPALGIKLRNGLADDGELEWEAKILRTEGALEESTLELFAIARIEDPFGLESEKVPLRVGQPVVTHIPGRTLENVFVIPRDAIRGLNRIRLADPETKRLASALITPLWTNNEHAVFRDDDIPDGMLLVLTRLVFAPDGGRIVVAEEVELEATAGGGAKPPFGKGAAVR